jgi:hypothetical protein
MPLISTFYGVLIYMYWMDDKRHHLPHIHAQFSGEEGIFDIETGDLIEGSLPRSKMRLVQAWIELHRDDLMADWSLAIKGESTFKIAPLG